ncbi:MAG: 2-C-methyl-D-erythritol 4-phosphate cytidylyltransferase, partial [Firmicutes bacterium]|nr:2-C-methyl-D-erythritol 4-phosphate cytidylyltransferase [Bacillota bacterium]
MKYIIMADGKGTRWQNYNDIPKHFIEIGGETLLARTVRLLNEGDGAADVIITSHDPRYEVPGARRYEPLNNHLEIDRFTEELIGDDVCFLYGDTYYSREAMDTILRTETEDMIF